ncbi:DUF4252 domain-containing protein [Bacteroidales bacterium OttesenSCG-928-C19]|nr:DUF4252 domain-containing protein [Bacteroidales bacterium OttesenSCG-928-C19]
MKKITVLAVLLFVFSPFISSGKTMEKLLKKYAKEDCVQFLTLPGNPGISMNGQNSINLEGEVSAMNMLVLDECLPDIRKDFEHSVINLKGIEELFRVAEENTDIRFFGHKTKRGKQELILFIENDDTTVFIYLEGDLDIDKIIEQNSKRE